MSDGTLQFYVIYRHPSDYPQCYVCRIHHSDGTIEPTPFAVGDTLEGVRSKLPAFRFNLGRDEEDDPAIVEMWV